MRQRVTVIGAGLAGSEAAFQLVRHGVEVDLFEMRPSRMTEAHTSSHCAELVCSNSFGSDSANSASRILKDELTRLGAEVLRHARDAQVPAGASLAVDRDKFSASITERIQNEPKIHFHREELTSIPNEGIVILATGPLTSPELAANLAKLVGEKSLYFYDAISPIVSADSLNLDKMFFANRYDKGETKDFLNIPLTKEQYEAFVDDLLAGDVVLPHEFEEARYFESCLPIETIASRGRQTLAFGPMKPVGLTDPRTGRWPYAAVQLRTENQHFTAYNLVGFQTKLKYGEQERILRKLPGLEEVEFLRLGSLHRNTFVHSPRVLENTLQLRAHPRVFIAGQLTGTEGYLESTATGWLAGTNAARLAREMAPLFLPSETMLGALVAAITDRSRIDFQPLNSNMGILPPLSENFRKNKPARNAAFSARSANQMLAWLEQNPLFPRAEIIDVADYRFQP